MRKLLIFLLVIITLIGVAYVASGYYMGMVTKSRIEQLTSDYQDLANNLTIEIKNYNQGIFQSTAKLRIKYENFSPFWVDLDILHKPIIYFDDGMNANKLHFYKLLLASNVSQVFLDKQTTLFSNVAVISPGNEEGVSIKVKLQSFSQMFYRLLGFYSTVPKYADALAEIKLDNDKFSVIIRGQGLDLISENTLYKLDASDYRVNINFYLNNIKDANWLNSYRVELTGANLTTSDASETQIQLSSPNLVLDFTGDFFYLLNFLKSGKSYMDLIIEDTPIKLAASFADNAIKIKNAYQDELEINNFKTSVEFNGGAEYKNFNTKLSVSDFVAKTSTDSANIKNLNINIDSKIHEEVISYLSLLLHSGLDLSLIKGAIKSDNLPFTLKANMQLNNLKSNGLLTGELNLDSLDFSFDLNEENKDKDLLLATEFKVDNLLWRLYDQAFKVVIENKKLNYIFKQNLSDYFSGLLDENRQLYRSNYSYNYDIPRLKFFVGAIGVDLVNLIGQGDFELNEKISGHLKNDVQMKNLILKISDSNLEISGLDIKSDMQQVQDYVLTGLNKVSASSLNVNVADTNFNTKDIEYNNKSTLIKLDSAKDLKPDSKQYSKQHDELSYSNEVRVNKFNLNKQDYGDLEFNNKFYDITLVDYQELMTLLNYIFLDQQVQHKLSIERQNEIVLDTLVNFFIQGLSSDNIVNINSNNDFLKVYNVTRFDNIRGLIDAQDKIEAKFAKVINNLNVAFQITIKEGYVNKLLEFVHDKAVDNFYKNIQKVGILNYNKDNIAEVKIIYANGRLLINNQSIDAWKKKLNKRNSNYFDQLKGLEKPDLEQKKGG